MGSQTLNREADSDAEDLSPADGRLLDQFIRERSDEAFALLVKRHGPYILGVCRRVTQHTQDAEDVFQACFLELARKASTISRRNSVAGWLQTVAVRMARKVRSKKARHERAQRARQDRQETMGLLNEPTTAAEEISWRETCRILEEQLARLPDDLRLPIIVCLFEGRTQEEAAQYLKINPRTLKDRLSRGREMLRKRLTRRGVSLAVLGTLLSGGDASASVSTSLAQATVRGASAVANNAASTAVIAPSVLSLMGGSVTLSVWPLLAAGLVGLAFSCSMVYVAWDTFASVPPSAQTDVQSTLRRSFRDGQFDNRLFKWSGPKAASYARRQREGLRLTLPSAGGPAQPVGIMLRHPLRGDFVVEATWQFVRVERPVSGWGIGATVYCFMDSPEWDGVWFGKLIHPRQGPVFAAGHRFKKLEDRTDKFVKTVAAAHDKGFARLRVVRRDSWFSVFCADQAADEFQLLTTFEVSPADATIVRFAADPAWAANSAVDVRLVDVAIKAEELVGYVP
jgi:RNA polymerase sigma factor (sigma-70 family)